MGFSSGMKYALDLKQQRIENERRAAELKNQTASMRRQQQAAIAKFAQDISKNYTITQPETTRFVESPDTGLDASVIGLPGVPSRGGEGQEFGTEETVPAREASLQRVMEIATEYYTTGKLPPGETYTRKSFEFTDDSDMEVVGRYVSGAPMYRKKPEVIFADPRTQKVTSGGKISAANRIIAPQLTPEEREISKARAGLVTPGEAGRYVLAQMARVNLAESKKILFPDGTAKSYKRGIAFRSKLPLLSKSMPFDKDAQTIYRNVSDSLAAKILIQTGVAARPEEVKAEYNKFYSHYFSNPDAAFEGFDKLGKFYKAFNALLVTKDPKSVERALASADEIGAPYEKPRTRSFATEADARAANLPKGTQVLIGGRRAVLD